VQVNCGALPDTLLESELFGHVKGAFTDARRDRAGRFVLAHRGTLFLDEVGDLSPAFQVKLLRVLEDGEVHPLGSSRSVRVDVRLVSASNVDLARRVRQGSFREDLYYRLRVVELALPLLSERMEDLPLLVDHFIHRLAARTGKPIRGISPDALAILASHDFPGNVRELRNVLERAFVLCHGATIEPGHLPAELRGEAGRRIESVGDARSVGERGTSRQGRATADREPSAESRRLLAALEAHRWNRTEAARELGIARNTLWRRLRALGLVRPRMR
jgi:DNA-binding NtrC family response regulator